MTITSPRRAAAALAATAALIGLSACGGSSSDDAAKAPKETSAPAPSETTTDAPAASGDQPEWAKPVSEVGDKIATVKAGDITVDVFQVGVTQATKTGHFVDPKDNKPIIDKGDDIVFVNYVVTNNGDPVDLGSSFVDVSARYDDWEYMQGMDSITDRDLFAQMKVESDVLAPGAFKTPSVYTFGSGQTFSYAENFRHQKNSPITFKVTAVPVDAEGKLVHDKRIEGEGKGTIK